MILQMKQSCSANLMFKTHNWQNETKIPNKAWPSPLIKSWIAREKLVLEPSARKKKKHGSLNGTRLTTNRFDVYLRELHLQVIKAIFSMS